MRINRSLFDPLFTCPRRAVLGCALAACCLVLGLAPGMRAASQQAIVTASLEVGSPAVRAGSMARAEVIAKVLPGYHVNSHHPSLSYLIPTALRLDSSKTFAVERIDYPEGKVRRFAFSDTGLSVYEGTLTINVLLKVNPGIAPGEYVLSGKLNYQACNDHACFPPASAPVRAKLRIAGGQRSH